jgi:GAF domain-containing protein
MAVGPSGQIVDEKATLRRVAMLVARAAPPEEVFAAVAAEAGRLMGADFAVLSRYDPDGTAMVVGTWAATGHGGPVPAGSRVGPGDLSVHTLVFGTGRPARIEDYGDNPGRSATIAREWVFRSVVGVPISLQGRLWGVIVVASRAEEPLPPHTEGWLAGFTDLVATAIANCQARTELRGFAAEQAALRRVAVLVARAAPPEEVFAAVTAEAGQLLEVDFTILSRYAADGSATIVGTWARAGAAMPPSGGTRFESEGRNVHSLVFRTGRPARMDSYQDASGPPADVARQWGYGAGVGVPISVDGRLWGVIIVGSALQEPLPADTEDRLAGFTELLATAIANTQARMELRDFAEEQAALRRVATLVARAAPPEEVFGAVSAEAGQLLEVDFTVLSRYAADGTVTVVGGWARTDPGRPLAVGLRMETGGRNLHTLVFDTGRPARIDDYADASGPAGDVARDWAFRSAVGAPISVEGRLWGVISVVSATEESLPAGTEGRLAGFTELVGTALANAEAQAALTASRARIVTAADDARRRIERDLHDGAQQQLVSLALQLRAAQAAVPPAAGGLAAELDGVVDGLTGVLDQLRDLAGGIHPAALAKGGLRAALAAMARRSAVPVRLDVRLEGRLPEPMELAVYYVVAETLANVVTHAHVTLIDVRVIADADADAGALSVIVRDDGRGGEDLIVGSRLLDLVDRVETLGGRISLRTPQGGGTTLVISLPLHHRAPVS